MKLLTYTLQKHKKKYRIFHNSVFNIYSFIYWKSKIKILIKFSKFKLNKILKNHLKRYIKNNLIKLYPDMIFCYILFEIKIKVKTFLDYNLILNMLIKNLSNMITT